MHTNKIELRFLGGVEGDIGGNIIFFGKNGRGYFFDFGLELTRSETLEKLNYPQEQIYNKELAQHLDPLVHNLSKKKVFLSHGHSDHWKGLNIIPVNIRREFIVYAPVYTKYLLDGRLKGFSDIKSIKINYRDPFSTSFNDNKLRVTAFPVDHSILGSCCYIIKDQESSNTFLYTGDFRTHGLLTGVLNRNFWDVIDSKKVKAVICEGTQFAQVCEYTNENDVALKVAEIIRSYRDRVILVVTSTNDLYRLKTIIQCAVKSQRSVYIYDDKIEGILKKIESFTKTKDSFVELLEKVGITSALTNVKILPSSGERRIEIFREMRQSPGKYVIVFTNVKSLFKILSEFGDALKGGCCIFSLSEFFEEELGIETEKIISLISENGLLVSRVHSSGHAFPEAIAEVLKKLSPETVFIVHSKDPKNFKKFLEGNDVKSQIYCPRKEEVFKF
jgi:mRNA degradation ribonuclease J1/J2